MSPNQCIALRLGKELHRICVLSGIPYYMLGGSMLGAIRHKGFIPWDDDMDFGIPRKYFSHFIQACREELPANCKLIYHDNSDYAILGFAKITDTSTIITETFSPISKEKIGVNIDVFPLDEADKKKGILSFNRRVRTLFKFQKLLFFEANNRSFLKKILARCSQLFIRIHKKKLLLIMERMIENKSSCDDLEMYVNYFGAWGLKELISKEVFGNPILYKFEDTFFYGVSDFDEYLKSLYGDYMVIPDEGKQHNHIRDIQYLE